jgi:hypothetical protein
MSAADRIVSWTFARSIPDCDNRVRTGWITSIETRKEPTELIDDARRELGNTWTGMADVIQPPATAHPLHRPTGHRPTGCYLDQRAEAGLAEEALRRAMNSLPRAPGRRVAPDEDPAASPTSIRRPATLQLPVGGTASSTLSAYEEPFVD